VRRLVEGMKRTADVMSPFILTRGGLSPPLGVGKGGFIFSLVGPSTERSSWTRVESIFIESPKLQNDASPANKLAGTSVYNAPETIAEIHDVMIGEASGKSAYSVKSSEGFLGIGEEYHPGPWSRSRDIWAT
jgi:hypothetical protein